KVVTGGALNRPRLTKPLRAKENLLGHDPGVGARCPQALKVLKRIAQSVGMIDPEARQTPLCNPSHYQLMSRIEHPLVLDPETDQRVDIKEAPVTEIARGHSPIRDAIILLLEQFMQTVGIGVQLRHDFV